jgi:primosomal protein N' (replication factor Y)
VEEELHQLFPETQVLRMDADTVTMGHEAVLREFSENNVPILLGTQMVAKGLDFENVTLVGVLAADLSLYVDHYRAAERTFSLLTQVVGRAGRGEKAGRAVIQTYTPNHDVIQAAAQQDYRRFYEGELRLRKLRCDPPFADLFTVTVTGIDEQEVRRAAKELQQSIRYAVEHPPYDTLNISVLGPAPATVVKISDRYRYRVTVMGKNEKNLRALLSHMMKEFSRRKENRRMQVYVDCNLMDER